MRSHWRASFWCKWCQGPATLSLLRSTRHAHWCPHKPLTHERQFQTVTWLRPFSATKRLKYSCAQEKFGHDFVSDLPDSSEDTGRSAERFRERKVQLIQLITVTSQEPSEILLQGSESCSWSITMTQHSASVFQNAFSLCDKISSKCTVTQIKFQSFKVALCNFRRAVVLSFVYIYATPHAHLCTTIRHNHSRGAAMLTQSKVTTFLNVDMLIWRESF